MRRRWLVKAVVCIGILSVGFIPWVVLARRPGVTRTNYERIRPGMKMEVVKELLGGDPGDYTTEAGRLKVRRIFVGLELVPFEWYASRVYLSEYKEWLGDEGRITIALDKNKRVIGKSHTSNVPERDPTIMTILRQWFR